MVGALRWPRPRSRRRTPGAALMSAAAMSATPDIGNAPGLKAVTLELRAGQITGLAGVSGNGQAALADLIGGLMQTREWRTGCLRR